MYKYILTILFVISFNVHSYEFNTFALEGSLKEKNSSDVQILSDKSLEPDQSNYIYTSILAAVSDSYLDIGQSQADDVLNDQGRFNLGARSFSGLTWQKAFGNFSMIVYRNLSPDLFDDKSWIVDDHLEIIIDAQTFLTKLQSEKKLKISDDSLALYAGLTFKRVFRFVHFAPDYKSAIRSDLSKLFLSFQWFRPEKIIDLNSLEMLSKEDYMTFKTGGVVAVPVGGFAGVSAGVMADYKKITKVVIQGVEDNNAEEDKFNISVEKESGKSILASARVNLEFFNLLRLTVFEYDFAYEYSEKFKTYLELSKKQFTGVLEDPEANSELSGLLSLKTTSVDALKEYVVSYERRISETESSRYGIFTLGAKNKRGVEDVIIDKDGKSVKFTKIFSKSVTYVQDLWSKVFTIMLNSVFKSDLGVDQYHTSTTRNLNFEYKISKHSSKRFEQEENASLSLFQEFKTRQEKRWSKHKHRDQALSFAKLYSRLDSDFISALENNTLVGPLSIKTNVNISKEGLIFFHAQEYRTIKKHISSLCATDKDPGDCIKDLYGKFRGYSSSIKGDIFDAFKLKNFLYALHKKVDQLEQWEYFFGQSNMHVFGHLNATRAADGKMVYTYFNEGTIKEVPIIQRTLNESMGIQTMVLIP